MAQLVATQLDEFLSTIQVALSEIEKREIRKAFNLAESSHAGQTRPSGELYFHHDVAVATLTADLNLDGFSIAAALLHDILLPHTGRSLADIARHFHPRVHRLVAGLRELDTYAEKAGLLYNESAELDHEKFRRALLIIIREEVQVILLRMADYVVDLRKAASLPHQARLALASEAMNIYAPLANRLGIWQLKWELEDLAFRYLEPDQYREIARRLNERRADREHRIATAREQLQTALAEANIPAAITGRSKHIYSIFRKMQQKKLAFDDIYDKYALRVVIETGRVTGTSLLKRKARKRTEQEARAMCYQVLGLVHSLWHHIPMEFDDYIANPKPNGYQSLHTAVIDGHGQALEIQIRTDQMHEEAEKGVAAHWVYKEDGLPSNKINKYVQNLRQLLNSATGGTDDELLDNELLRSELLAERIIAFTPRGDMIELPAGSTPIDFSYAIHTQVGHRCRGAKVNGKMVSLDYQLASGDRVEIITANRGGPSRDWMNENLGYTGSPRTRSKIRAWFRQQEREQNIQQGRDTVTRELRRLGLAESVTVEEIAQALGYSDVDRFLAAVGFGDIQSRQITGAIARLQQKLQPDDELRKLIAPPTRARRGLSVRGVSGLFTRMAGCCTPIPPEPIVGYITRGQGVTVHRRDCKTLASIDEQERIIDVEWGVENETYPIPIVVRAYQRQGLVEDIAKVLAGRNIEVPRTRTTTANSITTVYMVANISDLNELDWLLSRLERLANVLEVRRQRWNGDSN